MAKSINGWPIVKTGLTSLPQVTGRVLSGPVWVIFYWLCERYAAQVEPITKAWSWGWSYRKVAGSSKWSNHASGTAVDFNAPTHGAGRVGTFKAKQVQAIQLIIKASQGVLRWGHLFQDEMHFELAPGVSKAKVAELATLILQVGLSDAFVHCCGTGHWHALASVTPGLADGKRGPRTLAALRTFQQAHHLAVDAIDGPQTWAAISAARSKEGSTAA